MKENLKQQAGKMDNARMKSDKLVIFEDYSVAAKCSKCGEWDEFGADSKQATLLNQFEDKAKAWVCNSCYGNKGVMLQESGVQGYHIGQALNMAQQELLARGINSTTDNYWGLLLALRDEYLANAVLK